VVAAVLLEDARLERIVGDLLVLARLDEQAGEDGSVARQGAEVDLDEIVRPRRRARETCRSMCVAWRRPRCEDAPRS
jgi:hypothetical protein